MDTKELKELRDILIVDHKEYEKQRLPEIVKKASKYCKVDVGGCVHFESIKPATRDGVVLILVARFVASQLDNKINPDVNVTEVMDALNIPKNQAVARLHEAKKKRIALSVGKGVYTIAPYKIESSLNEIDEKYSKKLNKEND